MENSEFDSTLALRPHRKREGQTLRPEPAQAPKPKKKKKTAPVSLNLREILKKLMTSPTGYPFKSAPSPTDFPDYLTRVDHIDLSMVLKNLNEGRYRDNDAGFISDVRRVWTNALDYFPATSTRHQLAQANQKDFENYLTRLEKQKNPYKMMEDRLSILERKMAEVLNRLDRNERRKARPPTLPELERLKREIQALPDECRRGMIALAPDHFQLTGAGECQVNLENLPRESFEEIRKYIRRNRNKKPKKPVLAELTPPTADEEFSRNVRRGQAEIIQARCAGYSSDSSSSSDSSGDSCEPPPFL